MKKSEQINYLRHMLFKDELEEQLRTHWYRCTECGKLKRGTSFIKCRTRKLGIRKQCKVCVKVKYRERHDANPELYNLNVRNRYHKNHEASKTYQREKLRRYRANDPRLRLADVIGGTIRAVLGRGVKAGKKWQELVGYTSEELMKHLESQFTPEMSWDNYGAYWVVDHIIPKSRFEYDKPEGPAFKICWSLANLQPLTREENSQKGNWHIG